MVKERDKIEVHLNSGQNIAHACLERLLHMFFYFQKRRQELCC